MPSSQSFKNQHKELVDIVGKIAAMLQPATVTAKATDIRGLLTQLAGKVTMHLTMEDSTLYKAMLANPTTKPVAERFQREMGGIATAFKNYLAKYATPAAISSNAAAFIADTQGIAKALGDRIKREEAELYPAFEKI